MDQQGNAYLTGSTQSVNFPLQNALYKNFPNMFVSKIGFDGQNMRLLYSTFLGPLEAGSTGYGIALDGKGNAFVTGTTRDTQFPLRNAYQATLDRGSGGARQDAFMTKLNDGLKAVGALELLLLQ